MIYWLKHYLTALFIAMLPFVATAQSVAVKTNLFGWATTTTNLGLEFGMSRHSTLQLLGYLNPWDFGTDRHHFRFWAAQPEYRYWFCEKFNGWFLGVHAMGGQYNALGINFPLQQLVWGNNSFENQLFSAADHKSGWPDLRHENLGRHAEGWYVGGGISVGYQWMLSKHWNFEASVGVGYLYSPLTYYGRCRQIIDKRRLNYGGPTNAQLSFLYLF